MSEIRRRAAVCVLLLLGVVAYGCLGYWALSGGRWELFDCLYMTVISVSTVGYGETFTDPPLDAVAGAKAFTLSVILLGLGTFGYAASTLTASLIDANLPATLRKKRMRKRIEALTGHVIVCGAGTTGRHVVEEMVATGTPLVVVDTDEERLLDLVGRHPEGALPYIVGDATEDEVLNEAGVARARGIVAALPDEKDNLYVVITARSANPGARIVARAGDVRAFEKLRKAGANSVVSPNFIGGMRLASEMLRPHVLEFLDEMIRDRDKNLRIEEVDVPPGSPWVGKTLRETRIRDVTDALVLAIRDRQQRSFSYNPGPGAEIKAGTTLVVLGRSTSVQQLRHAVDVGFDSMPPAAPSPDAGRA